MTPGASLLLTRELEPGQYAFYCSMPASKRLAYFQLGMVRGFEVAGTSDAEPPDVDGTITVREDSIQVPAIEAGTRTFELENTADGVRELKLLSLRPGQKPADLEAWFANRFVGEPPADMLGVLGKLAPGESAYATITFESGRTYHLFDGPSRRGSALRGRIGVARGVGDTGRSGARSARSRARPVVPGHPARARRLDEVGRRCCARLSRRHSGAALERDRATPSAARRQARPRHRLQRRLHVVRVQAAWSRVRPRDRRRLERDGLVHPAGRVLPRRARSRRRVSTPVVHGAWAGASVRPRPVLRRALSPPELGRRPRQAAGARPTARRPDRARNRRRARHAERTYEGKGYRGDTTTFFVPSIPVLRLVLEERGFVVDELVELGERALVFASRDS